MIMRKLGNQTNEDGDLIYEGTLDEKDRTGSNLKQLVQYAMGRAREKPIDYSVFVHVLTSKLKIPRNLLYSAQRSWIQFT